MADNGALARGVAGQADLEKLPEWWLQSQGGQRRKPDPMEGTGWQGLARQLLREATRGPGISQMALEVPAPAEKWQRQVLHGGHRGEGYKGRKGCRQQFMWPAAMEHHQGLTGHHSQGQAMTHTRASTHGQGEW